MQNDHAIVIGASLAGLLAARVLSNHFQRVTVLDRDALPTGDENRAGVPQARHAHGLLLRGLREIDAMFPGLEVELLEAGAVRARIGSDFAIMFRSGWSPQIDCDLYMLSFSRALLESRIRRRVAAIAGVTLRGHARLEALAPKGDRTIAGVIVNGERLEADLVVDASGRGSHLPALLEQIGIERPDETTVDAFWGYASRIVRRPANAPRSWRQLLVLNAPPDQPRVGVLQPIEQDRWLITAAGVMKDYPPTDEAGFTEFLRTLRSPLIHQAVRDAEPLGPIHGFRHTSNRLRHYDRMRRWPERLIALGDSVCAFNPVYGQGMTVAALEVRALDELLTGRRHLDGFARLFQKRVAKIIKAPFMLATSEDSRWPGTSGATLGLSTRIMHRYVDRVIDRLPTDPDLYARFMRINHMIDEPTAMFGPAFIRRAFAAKPRAPRLLAIGPTDR